jgi:exodeoxyribonuclease VII small subunit
MTDTNSPDPSSLSFGDALSELDSIVAALEGGDLELEESLARYERGVGLLRALQAKLNDAEQQVKVLIGELEQEAGDSDEGETAPPLPADTRGDDGAF